MEIKGAIETGQMSDRNPAWWSCVAKGVTPVKLIYRPGAVRGYRAYFTYKFGENESREAAFTYLKCIFSAENMYAFRHAENDDGMFYVKFDIGND